MIDFLWKNFFKKEETNIETILKANPLFENLSDKELKLLNNLMHQRSFIPGEFVFQEGKGLGMYIILRGKINILHGNSNNTESSVISQLNEGDFFGELALVHTGAYRNMFAQSAGDSKLLGFFQPDLKLVLENYPLMGIKILRKICGILSHRLQKAEQKILQAHSSQ